MGYTTSFGTYRSDRYNTNVHKDYEIIYYVAGEGRSHVGESFFDVKKGTIVIVPPNTKHGSISFNDLQFKSLIGNSNGLLHLENFAIFKDNERGDGLSLMQMIQENRYGEQDFFHSLCIAFIHFVLKGITISDPIENAVNHIKNQMITKFHDSDFNATELLNQSGYAEDYIRAQFKKIVGRTPVQFLTELRIKHATTLINIYQSSTPLSDISINCGFDDYVYFSRKFKKIVGISPIAYQKSLLIDKKE